MKQNPSTSINYGLRYIPDLRKDDYRFGAFNGVVKEVLKEDSDWSDLRPTPESQAYTYFDDFSCVTHSDLDSISAVFDQKIKLGKFRPSDVQWLRDNDYFDEHDRIDFNDRFIAKVSNTVCAVGNYQSTVADAIREFGLPPQSKWDYDKDDIKSCPEFMSDPPQEMFDLGQEFNQRFRLNYELVSANSTHDINDALKYSPLQVIVCAWYKNEDGLYYKPTDRRFNHAVVKYKPANPTHWIWDSYSDYDNTPFEKELVKSYVFGNYAYVWYVTETLTEDTMIFYKERGESAIYQHGTDDVYYPINSGETFKRLYGDFDDNKIIEVEHLEKKGERLGLVI